MAKQLLTLFILDITVQDYSLIVWIGLTISAIVIAAKITPLTTKLFFVMAVLKLLMLIGTQQTIILLGFLMVSS